MPGLSDKLINAIKDAPGIRTLRERRWEKDFASRRFGNYFKGVYPDFATALAAIPTHREVGYDNPGPASMYLERTLQVHATDYPVLYWLKPLLRPDLKVFDLGGHIGVSFYSYSEFLGFPEGLRWTVCDVAAVTEAGAALARERGRDDISFTTDRAGAEGTDVYLANGSLQYVEEHFAVILDKLQSKPAHVFINMLPVHEEHEFVTLNNIGSAICPYTVHNRRRFIERVCSAGYEMVDEWDNPGKTCIIPFHEDHSTRHYFGAYFRQV